MQSLHTRDIRPATRFGQVVAHNLYTQARNLPFTTGRLGPGALPAGRECGGSVRPPVRQVPDRASYYAP